MKLDISCDSHEMPSLIFSENYKKIFRISSATILLNPFKS